VLRRGETETLRLTPSESVTIVEASPERLVVEGTWGPGGKPPPKHHHPHQSERFEVLEGELRFRVGGEERNVGAGEGIDVPVATPHQVWNPSGEQARATWVTEPAGRTEEWFRAVDALNREAGDKAPSVIAFAPLVREFGDTFRLSGPAPVMDAAVAGLAAVGRLLGHGRT
jgi:mannose-6-phosphate isomerase-like protein (cupin superfamily)